MVNSFSFLVSGSSLYQPVSFVISFYPLMFAAAGALFELNPQLVERVPFLKRQQVAMAVQSTQGAVRGRPNFGGVSKPVFCTKILLLI